MDFIELPLVRTDDQAVCAPEDLVREIRNGSRVVLLGDYGAGKSMTLRHVYQELRAGHLKGDSPRFPVFINLRDHYGQTMPNEVIERHARIIGFQHPTHLVRAWRAGYVYLLLDGFDEITAVNIQGLWKRLQDNRYRAMEAVRRLRAEHPPEVGLAIAGRAHFFDTSAERVNALGLKDRHQEYSLLEFDDAQVAEFFSKSGFSGAVPKWLPSRPLLVAYLASKGLLNEVTQDGSVPHLEASTGWDMLLDRVAEREAEIEAGIDGGTVRRILERLATRARGTSSGLGPLTPEVVLGSFQSVCGYAADERGLVLLQRLPGLGVDREEEGTRAFVDEDFADACAAGDVVHYIDRPYEFEHDVVRGIDRSLGDLGTKVAVKRARDMGVAAGKVNAAIRRARELHPQYLAADVMRVGIECGYRIEDPLHVQGLLIPCLDLSRDCGDARKIKFVDCFFSWIGIDGDVDVELLPRFMGCYIDEVDGRQSRRDLPSGVFSDDCMIEKFSSPAETTDAVLGLELPLGTRVALTILKKLYERRGAGRKENALFRGLDHHARRVVPGVLKLVQSEGLAAPVKRGDVTIWVPDRSSQKRVGRMVAGPTVSKDAFLIAAGDLS